MNVISYDSAYCLFPRATLEERRSLLSWSSQGRSKRRAEGLIKYSARGFRMLHFLDPDDLKMPKPNRAFTFGPRWLGDPYTWVIPLDMEGVLPPPPPNPYSSARSRDPVVLTSFSVRYNSCDGAIMDFSVVQSPILKFSVVTGDSNITNHLTQVLHRKTNDEQYKVMICFLEDWR